MTKEKITLCLDCRYRKGTSCQKKKIEKDVVIKTDYIHGGKKLVRKDIPRYRSVQIVRSDNNLCGHEARWFALRGPSKHVLYNVERDAKIFELAKSDGLNMTEIGKLFNISSGRVGQIVHKAYRHNARFVEREKIHDLAASGVPVHELSIQFKVGEWCIKSALELPRTPLKS